MLKGEKFDAFALMLSNKYTFAYYQILLCFLSKMYKYKNVYMFLYLYIINYATL